jgi:hypothetical protein
LKSSAAGLNPFGSAPGIWNANENFYQDLRHPLFDCRIAGPFSFFLSQELGGFLASLDAGELERLFRFGVPGKILRAKSQTRARQYAFKEMKILPILMISLASAHATTLYNYDLGTNSLNPLGSGLTARLSFYEPFGKDVPIVEALYDLSFYTDPNTSQWTTPELVERFGIQPEIPAYTFHLADANYAGGLISWGFEVEQQTDFSTAAIGSYYLSFGNGAGSAFSLSEYAMQEFWPVIYSHNEGASFGPRARFVGTEQVPEGGSTLLYLAIGMIAFIWRKL